MSFINHEENLIPENCGKTGNISQNGALLTIVGTRAWKNFQGQQILSFQKYPNQTCVIEFKAKSSDVSGFMAGIAAQTDNHDKTLREERGSYLFNFYGSTCINGGKADPCAELEDDQEYKVKFEICFAKGSIKKFIDDVDEGFICENDPTLKEGEYVVTFQARYDASVELLNTKAAQMTSQKFKENQGKFQFQKEELKTQDSKETKGMFQNVDALKTQLEDSLKKIDSQDLKIKDLTKFKKDAEVKISELEDKIFELKSNPREEEKVQEKPIVSAQDSDEKKLKEFDFKLRTLALIIKHGKLDDNHALAIIFQGSLKKLHEDLDGKTARTPDAYMKKCFQTLVSELEDKIDSKDAYDRYFLMHDDKTLSMKKFYKEVEDAIVEFDRIFADVRGAKETAGGGEDLLEGTQQSAALDDSFENEKTQAMNTFY